MNVAAILGVSALVAVVTYYALTRRCPCRRQSTIVVPVLLHDDWPLSRWSLPRYPVGGPCGTPHEPYPTPLRMLRRDSEVQCSSPVPDAEASPCRPMAPTRRA